MKEVQSNSYVDLKKFTPWQKEWFIGNANWVSSCSTKQAALGKFELILFKEWYNLKDKRWGTSSVEYLEHSKELSFNALYDGAEYPQEPSPTLPEYQSTPRWVTFDANQDMLDVWYDILEDGKDYKVVEILGNLYVILFGEEKMVVHKSFFHEVTKDDLLPNKTVEESFDNLVRSKYVLQEGDYFVLSKLSGEQKGFLSNNFITYDDTTFSDFDWVIFQEGTFYGTGGYGKQHEIFFNDLFVEKDS